MPTYSVIIVTYNRKAFLREAIDSVLAQTYRDFELIVCDDGSTDGTQALLDSYGDKIRVLKLERVGVGAARNAGIRAAKGTYSGFLDSDDVWMPWTLECIDRVVLETGGDAVVYLDPKPRPPEAGDPVPLQTSVGALPVYQVYESFHSSPRGSPEGSGLMGAVPMHFWSGVGGFPEEWLNGGDTDVTLRLARVCRYAVVREPTTILIRTHANQISNNMSRTLAGWQFIRDNYRRGLYDHPRLGGLEHRRLGQMLMGRAYYLPAAGHWLDGLRSFGAALLAIRRVGLGAGLGWSLIFYPIYFALTLTSSLLRWESEVLARWTHKKRFHRTMLNGQQISSSARS
jgi:glycosyltransferase involved in cell wall biosynthesis